MDDPQLSTWADRQAFAAPILALEAREGFSKSYLCSTVIRHLNYLYPPGRQDPRVSVAYYYFEKDNKDDKSVNKALRALIWQLTQNDPAYEKAVAGACDKSEEFGETLELWNNWSLTSQRWTQHSSSFSTASRKQRQNTGSHFCKSFVMFRQWQAKTGSLTSDCF